ncbi:MAG: enoyl-CoA hydratase/isomerase family protein [Alphaproteobacteria bacterium]|nr:enoyl-CoA hydratase/isomerase family protein [Alphaproteobacteria bacterium]MCB9931299.1 enoyl-CoA hydratase/isomerase family protein [Alphaproteobacteria bacterium]
MPVSDRILYDVRDRVATIAMNRAPVNAIDHAMIDAIHAAMRRAEADRDVRAVILTSALDGMFCGGMDLKMVAAGDALDLRRFVTKFYIGTMNIQYEMTKPTVVAVNGPARGTGMTLAITSDVVLAADDIDLGYPEIDVGVIPAIHYVHLPRQISRHKAFELLFGGQPIPAAEAVSLGIVNHAVPRTDLMDRAFAMARMFAEKSPTIMALGRQSFMRANDLDYRRNVENQIETLCNIFNTADGREGLQAFLEKRKPRWGE